MAASAQKPKERDVIADAVARLEAEGLSSSVAQSYVLSEDMARTFLSMPESALAGIVAQQSSQSMSPYATADAMFGTPTVRGPKDYNRAYLQHGVGAPSEYEISADTGALRFQNGVIADPGTGDVFFPPNDASVAGSPAWLRRIQKRWNPKKIQDWRNRLNKYGYEIGEKGGYDLEFQAALGDFHRNKYLNGGNPIPQTDSKADVVLPDNAEIDNNVTETYRRVFGDDPSQSELDEWRKSFKKTARKLQRKKGYDPSYAATVAEERFISDFEKDPQVQFFTDAQEENTALRDSIIAAGQAMDSL